MEKKDTRNVKPKDLAPFEGMEVRDRKKTIKWKQIIFSVHIFDCLFLI